jgi:membrane protease YdiL (CAAX protease family)
VNSNASIPVNGTVKKAKRHRIKDIERSDMEAVAKQVNRNSKRHHETPLAPHAGDQRSVEKGPEQFIAGGPIFYLSFLLLAASELALTIDIGLGMLMYAGLIMCFAAGVSYLHKEESTHENNKETYRNAAGLLAAVMLLPLIRIFDFALPLVFFRQVYWPLIVSVPLLVAVAYLAKNLNIRPQDSGLILGNVPLQLAVGLTGIAFGLFEYGLIHPMPLISALAPEAVLVPALILLAFTGFTEELVFRGLIQTMGTRVYGAIQGILLSSAYFTVMHLGFNSGPHLAYVMAVSVFYGAVFYRTKSISGVVLSHGLTNIVLFMVAPFVLI